MKSKAKKIIDVPDLGVDPNFWVTPLGDMMTFLMIFFLILWAYTQFVQKKETRTMPTPTHIKTLTILKDLEHVAEIKVTKRKVAIELPEAVLFNSGRAGLKPGAIKSLSLVADVLKKTNAPIVVEGHTDNIPVTRGKWKNNWQLSAGRAFSVIQYLTDKEGISPKRLSARGYGPYRQIAPFDTDRNRRKNRRVEINILTSETSPENANE